MTRSRTNRLWALALCLCLVLSLFGFPAPAGAAQITTAIDLTGTPTTTSGDGWSWDQASTTLTLTGIDLKCAGVALNLPADATINLSGSNSIESTGSPDAVNSYGIHGAGALTIKGTGTLNVQSGAPTSNSSDSVAIFVGGALTIEQATVTATCTSGNNGYANGIYVYGNLSLKSGAQVKATGGNGNSSSTGYRSGVNVTGTLSLEDATTTLIAAVYGTTQECGVYAGTLPASGTATATGSSNTGTSDETLTTAVLAYNSRYYMNSNYVNLNLTKKVKLVAVVPTPTITLTPDTQTIGVGMVTYSIALDAVTEPLTAKWYPTIDDYTNGTNASTAAPTGIAAGAPSAGNGFVLNVTANAASDTYYFGIHDGIGTKAMGTLVVAMPSITVTPQSQAMKAGESANATFAYELENLTASTLGVVWYTDDTYTDIGSPPTGIFTNASGGTLTVTGITTSQAGSYYFKLYDSGTGTYSNGCVLTVTTLDAVDFTLTAGDGEITITPPSDASGSVPYYMEVSNTSVNGVEPTEVMGWLYITSAAPITIVDQDPQYQMPITNGTPVYVQMAKLSPGDTPPIAAWSEKSVTPVGLDELTFSLTPGNGEATVVDLARESGYDYFYTAGTTAVTDANKPAYGSMAPLNWEQLTSNTIDMLTNDVTNYVQIAKATATDGAVAWGYSTVTPAAPTPTITVGTQTGTAVVGTVSDVTYTVAAENFVGVPVYTYKWYTDASYATETNAPFGVLALTSGNTLTVSTATTTPQDTYYFKVIGNGTVESNGCELAVTPPAPTITVGAQIGAVSADQSGSATYLMSHTGFPTGFPAYETPAWFSDAQGTVSASAPTGITPSYLGDALTLSYDGSGTQGTYYFTISVGNTTSSVGTLILTGPSTVAVTPTSGTLRLNDASPSASYDYTLTGLSGGSLDLTWYTSSTYTDLNNGDGTAPNAIHAVQPITGGSFTIEPQTGTPAVGTYYFKLTHFDGIDSYTHSNGCTLTVTNLNAVDFTLTPGDEVITVTLPDSDDYLYSVSATSVNGIPPTSTSIGDWYICDTSPFDVTGPLITNGTPVYVQVIKTSGQTVTAWSEKSDTPVGLDELDFDLTPGNGKLTVSGLTLPAPDTGYYYKAGTTAPSAKPAYGNTDLTGWTSLPDNGEIPATNGTLTYVEIVLSDSTAGFIAYGTASGTPALPTLGTVDFTLTPGDDAMTITPPSDGGTYYYKVTAATATAPTYGDDSSGWTLFATQDAVTVNTYDAGNPIANGTIVYVQVVKASTTEGITAWSEKSATPIGTITPVVAGGRNSVTLTTPSGTGTFYAKASLTACAAADKPKGGDAFSNPAGNGWTLLDAAEWAITAADSNQIPDNTTVYVQVVQVNTVDSDTFVIGWGEGNATTDPAPVTPPGPGLSKTTPEVKPDGGQPLDLTIEAGDSDPVEVPVNLSGANISGGMELTCTIGGVTATATATENGEVIFEFPAGALDGLKEGEHDIVVSFPGDANNNGFSTVVGKLSAEAAEEFDIGIDVLAVRKGKRLVLPKLKGYTGTWSVEDGSIAVITKNGKRVKALGLGTTKLVYKVDTAPKKALVIADRALKAGDSYAITLNVRKRGELVTKVALDKKKLALSTVGENTTAKLTATVKPAKALDKEVFWTSTDPKVATVDRHGNVTAVGAGKCKIIAVGTSLKRASATVTVTGAITVKPAKKKIKIGKTLNLTATVADGIGGELTWTTSDASVATVDENGVVTALSNGKAIITAMAANGETATCTLTVKKK